MGRKLGICLWLAIALASAAARLPQFSLADTGGNTHTPAEWSGKRAVVLFFLTTDCPLCNNYVPAMNRLAQAFSGRGVAFYGVQGDATVPDADVRRHVKDFAYTFPYQFDPSGQLWYLGRIDNRLEDFGKQRVQVTEFDLRDTLEAILNGKPVPHARTKALGCAITRKD
jgi:peroxiredoxin